MYCPKCGDSLKEQGGVFRCERGQMELPPFMAERLYAGFVSKTEQPEDFQFTNAGYHLGGQWFCPGCGVFMNQEEPGTIRCPQCRRNIGKYLFQLVELHPRYRDGVTRRYICDRELNNPTDPRSMDCGGDCLQCMADAGDAECIEEIRKIEAAEQR